MTLKFDNNEILVINDTLFLSHIGSESTDEMRYVEIFEDGEVSKTLLRVPYPYSLENARWWIDFTRQQYIDIGVHFNYAIRRKCDQNMNLLIGGIGINNIDSSSHSAEIGYWLDKSEWGQGLMPTIIYTFVNSLKKKRLIVFSLFLASVCLLLKYFHKMSDLVKYLLNVASNLIYTFLKLTKNMEILLMQIDTF